MGMPLEQRSAAADTLAVMRVYEGIILGLAVTILLRIVERFLTVSMLRARYRPS